MRGGAFVKAVIWLIESVCLKGGICIRANQGCSPQHLSHTEARCWMQTPVLSQLHFWVEKQTMGDRNEWIVNSPSSRRSGVFVCWQNARVAGLWSQLSSADASSDVRNDLWSARTRHQYSWSRKTQTTKISMGTFLLQQLTDDCFYHSASIIHHIIVKGNIIRIEEKWNLTGWLNAPAAV